MPSNPPPAPDVILSQDKDGSSNCPLGRRKPVHTSSHSSPRYSLSSNQTGESSTAATNRNRPTVDAPADVLGERGTRRNGGFHGEELTKAGGGSYRGRRNRSSGGFLLSDSFWESPSHSMTVGAPISEKIPNQRPAAHDSKGKAALEDPRGQQIEHRSNPTVDQGRSPLAPNTTAAPASQHPTEETIYGKQDAAGDGSGTQSTAVGLDFDSAKIVNLALNLSESRRNARRNISTPLPPVSQGPKDGFVGGSLRQHLQQQRRASRNVSPKADRAVRAITTSPRVTSGAPTHSPLQATFEMQSNGSYQYHFSPSTLARAAKAKNAIELMAEYRRLLQYVPPLKPQPERITSNDAGGIPSSPTSTSVSRSASASSHAPRPLGRLYNPLQYIRNRKVRARNSKAIDGESQGFGDLSKVSSWIDRVSKEALSESSHLADCLYMPSFSKAADAAASPHTSPQSGSGSGSGKGQAAAPKIKRPRIDWVTNPADMIADVFWLELDDNKKMIENRHGGKIFPPTAELKRPISRSEAPESQLSPSPALKRETSALDLEVDTKLPEFKPIKADLDKHTDSTAARARQRLRHVRNATRIYNHNGPIHDRSHIFRSHSISHSDSSDSDAQHQPARRRSGTADSNDRGTDILEKQMLEMLRKEAKETDRNNSHDFTSEPILQPGRALKPMPKAAFKIARDGSDHRRSDSLANKRKMDSVRNGFSGRASLEVPNSSPRRSLEELDSTAPNSPEMKGSVLSNAFVPSLAMNFSPPRSRNTSQTRKPLSKVKSKILPFRDHSLERSRSRIPVEESLGQIQALDSKEQTPASPGTPERRRRSMSPTKPTPSRKVDDDLKPLKKTSSLRKSKGEDSGIRGLFKSSRNPVARVGELLWKSSKEHSPDFGVSSSFSTDESDVEDFRASQAPPVKRYAGEGFSKIDERDTGGLSAQSEASSRINEMPVFTSPFEHRGRPTRGQSEDVKVGSERQNMIARNQIGQVRIPDPTPRIDVQTASPTSSPERGPIAPFHRDPSISDQDSRRGSSMPGVESADARLNAILGLPGKRRDALPVTGLANLDVTHDQNLSHNRKRQWSISDRGVSIHRGPMTKREIGRVRALLLSSGIKAKEISRRAAELRDLGAADEAYYSDIAELAQKNIAPVPRSKQHLLAARILSSDIQLSSRMWQESADTFANTTITGVLTSIEKLQTRLSTDLTPMTRKAADDADEVSKDLVTSQTLTVKQITDKIDTMMRRRRRRFRWLRRGGWVLLEWALVGVMWCVWFVVVLARVVMGMGKGAVGIVRWLFWL